MPDVYYPNKAPASPTDYFSHAWFITRCLLKAGWQTKASSDGTNKETTGGPASCKWGVPASTANTGAAASIGAATGVDFLITGLTGMVAPTRSNQGGCEGNYLLFSGAASAGNNAWFQVSKYVSATSVYARPMTTAGVASDANNGAITWTEKNPLTTTYSAMTNAWIVLRGPSTLKIAFTSAPSGVFIRGENIVQGTTGAEGELLGVTYEPTTGVGFMVVAPRLSGSGGGARGWNSSSAITGAKSSATVTPSANPIDYVREFVLMRGAASYNGTAYYGCLDVSGESASLFTTLAASAGCTATVPPGGGGTSNAFPATGVLAMLGSGGSVSHSNSAWQGTIYNTANTIGNLQLFAANAIERQTASADGSFLNIVGQPTQDSQSTGTCIGALLRVDNAEEGDLDPYVVYSTVANGSVDTRTRTTAATATASLEGMDGSRVLGLAAPNWVGFRKRGLSGETFQDLYPALLYAPAYGTLAMISIAGNSTDPEKVAASAQTSAPVAIEPLVLVGQVTAAKIRKGSPRYLFALNGNVAYDTFGSKQWLQTARYTAGALATLSFVMPYDGSTVPVQ